MLPSLPRFQAASPGALHGQSPLPKHHEPCLFQSGAQSLAHKVIREKMQTRRGCGEGAEGKGRSHSGRCLSNLGLQPWQVSRKPPAPIRSRSSSGFGPTEGAGGTSKYLSGTAVPGPSVPASPPPAPLRPPLGEGVFAGRPPEWTAEERGLTQARPAPQELPWEAHQDLDTHFRLHQPARCPLPQTTGRQLYSLLLAKCRGNFSTITSRLSAQGRRSAEGARWSSDRNHSLGGRLSCPRD